MHYGVEGQKWGVRRYQNADGSLTAEGKAHYGVGEERVNELKNELRTRKNYKKNGIIKGKSAQDVLNKKNAFKKEINEKIDSDSAVVEGADDASIVANDIYTKKAKDNIDKLADEIYGSDKMLKNAAKGFQTTMNVLMAADIVIGVASTAYAIRKGKQLLKDFAE